MEWVILVVFIIITAFLLTGKGGWLISGYNTLPKKEKAKYDEKKLSRQFGLLLLVFDIEFLILNILMNSKFGIENEMTVSLGMSAIMVVTIFLGIFIINKRTKKKN